MADDSQSPTPPNINLYNVASDDALWVLETDHEQLLEVLADPAGWVRSNVKIEGEPATLWEPFVVVFHEVAQPVRTPSVHTEGVQKPIVHVKGIHETAVLTVRYSRSTAPPPPPAQIVPPTEVLAILQVGTVVHTHLQLTGFSPRDVGQAVFTRVSSPEAFIAAINELPQTLNGTPTDPGKKLKFMLHPTNPMHVIYQGWTPKPSPAGTGEPQMKSMGSTACCMSDGDANSQGQVIVNGVVVKTYTLPPGPGGGGGG